MKNKILRILSLALAVTTTLSTSIPVFAYDVDEHDNSIESVEYQITEDEDFNNVTNVFAQLGSEYKITIPKVVVLSGVSKAASYYVKVEGDIAGYEKVKVVPEDNFKLSAKNKADETATVNQDKTVWTVHDFDIDANGHISAKDITAGKWTGAFNFNINLETEKVAGDTVIEEPVHTHTAGEAVKENKIAVTYDKEGSYDEVTYCSDCGEELSRIKKIIPIGGLFDENNNLIKSWDELVELGLDIEKDYNYFSSASDFYKNVPSSGYSVFTNNNLSGKLIIPDTVTSIGLGAFFDCTSLESVTIPDSVTSIGDYAFRNCSSLTSINIPNSVTKIDSCIFSGCTSLTSVTIPDSVTSISGGMFENCTSLESVTIPNSVTSIGDWAFRNCKSLTSINIPNSVTKIDDWAFRDCKSLTSINIPNSVTKIGGNAFMRCTSLKSITYRGVTYTDKTTFNNKLKSDGVATADAWT